MRPDSELYAVGGTVCADGRRSECELDFVCRVTGGALRVGMRQSRGGARQWRVLLAFNLQGRHPLRLMERRLDFTLEACNNKTQLTLHYY